MDIFSSSFLFFHVLPVYTFFFRLNINKKNTKKRQESKEKSKKKRKLHGLLPFFSFLFISFISFVVVYLFCNFFYSISRIFHV